MKFGKSISTVALGLTAIGIAGFASSGAQAASANGTANATIVQAIGITAGNTLEFGDILNGNVAVNTVTVDTADGIAASDPSQIIGGTPQSATFNVTGDPGRTYSITLPGSVTLNCPCLDTMTVDNFTDSHTVAATTPTLSGAGTDTFSVGADLTVAVGQTPGAYTGTFVMTVNY